MRPHRRQPTRLPRPWHSPGKDTGVGCHFLLRRMKVKSESEVTQSYRTLSDPMDCSLPGSSAHGIFQARVLEWGAIAFSDREVKSPQSHTMRKWTSWELGSLASESTLPLQSLFKIFSSGKWHSKIYKVYLISLLWMLKEVNNWCYSIWSWELESICHTTNLDQCHHHSLHS